MATEDKKDIEEKRKFSSGLIPYFLKLQTIKNDCKHLHYLTRRYQYDGLTKGSGAVTSGVTDVI